MTSFAPKDYNKTIPVDPIVADPTLGDQNTLAGIQSRFRPMLAAHGAALDKAMADLEKDSSNLGAAAGVQAAQAALTTGYGAVMSILSGLNKAQEKAIQNIA